MVGALVLLTGCIDRGASPGTSPLAAQTIDTTRTPVPTLFQRRSPPPGVAVLPDDGVPLDPGTYWWTLRFPWLEIEVGEGWAIGKHEPDYLDFVDPGAGLHLVGIGRFTQVFIGGGLPVGARNADAVVSALQANNALIVEEVGPVSLFGLDGRTIDIRMEEDPAPLFVEQAGVFYLPEGFEARFHVLDVNAGALEVWIAAPEGELDAALEIAQPLLDGIRLVE
jgi:hypothetical protein